MAGLFDDLLEAAPQEARAPVSSGLFDDLLVSEPKPEGRTVLGTLQDVGVTALKGAVALPQAAVGLADILTLGRAGKVLESVGYRPGEAQATLETMFSPAQQAANRKVQQAEGFLETAKAALQNPSTIAVAAGESLPQMLAGGAVARGVTALAPKVAPWLAAGIGEGVMGAGSAASQTREQNPDRVLTPGQAAAAVGSGVGTAAFGAAGNKLAGKLGVGDIDTMLAGGKLAKSPKGFVRQVVEAGVSEGAFEELPQSVQEQMWQNYATGRPLSDGVGNAAAMGLITGAAVGGAGGGFNAASSSMRPRPADIAATELAAALETTPAPPVPDRATLVAQERAKLEAMRTGAITHIGAATSVDDAIQAAQMAVSLPTQGPIEVEVARQDRELLAQAEQAASDATAAKETPAPAPEPLAAQELDAAPTSVESMEDRLQLKSMLARNGQRIAETERAIQQINETNRRLRPGSPADIERQQLIAELQTLKGNRQAYQSALKPAKVQTTEPAPVMAAQPEAVAQLQVEPAVTTPTPAQPAATMMGRPVADFQIGQLLQVANSAMFPDQVREVARQEVKRREIESMYAQRDLAPQAKAAEEQAIVESARDEQVDQANALTEAQTIDAPSAMQLAFQRAQAQQTEAPNVQNPAPAAAAAQAATTAAPVEATAPARADGATAAGVSQPGAAASVEAAGVEVRMARAPEEPFGPVLTTFRGDALGAIAELSRLQDGEAVGALSHPEVGDIDLVWGKAGTKESNGYGLAKLVKWHPEVLGDLQGVISSLQVVERTRNRIQLESATHKAAVRLEWDSRAKNWLLTAFEKRGAGDGTRTDTTADGTKDDTARLEPGPTGSVVAETTSDNPVAEPPDLPAAQSKQEMPGSDDQGQQQFSRPLTSETITKMLTPMPARMSVEQVQTEVDAVSKTWKAAPPIRVVDTVEDLPFRNPPANARGAYDGRTIWVVAANHRSPATLRRTIAHEAVAHAGLRGMLGEQDFGKLLRTVKVALQSKNKPLLEIQEDVRRIYVDDAGNFNLTEESEMDEIIARATEVAVDLNTGKIKDGFGAFKQVYSRIAEWLRNVVGLKVPFSMTELHGFLLRSEEYLNTAPQRLSQQPEQKAAPVLANDDNGVDFARADSAEKSAAVEKDIKSSMGDLTPAQAEAWRNVTQLEAPPSVSDRLATMKANIGIRMKQGIFDQFAPIKEVDQNAYMLARMSKGSDGTMEAALLYGKPFLRDGVPDVDVSGGGFASVLADLQGEHDRFFWWVAAQRAELLKAQGKENLFGDSDIAALKSLNQGKMPDGKNREVAYLKAQKELNAFNDSVLKVAQESGLIDKEALAAFKDQPYVPFYRQMEDGGYFKGPKFSSGLVGQKAFQKLKGGTDKLNSDLLENTLLNWSHLYSAAARNRAALATMDAAAEMDAAYRVEAGAKGAVKVMRDGVTEHWMAEDPYLLEAISALNYAPSSLLKALSKPKQYLTFGVTVNPTFKARNLIRDTVSAISQAELSYNPVKNVAQGWKLSASDSQVYASMLASGGVIKFGTQENSERVRKQVEKLGGVVLDKNVAEKLWAKTKDGWSAYQEVGDRLENVNRVALYDQLVKSGKTHAEAAFMARDLMDFSMSGNWAVVRFLTQTVPFLNARLQGLYKLGRAAHENPARFATMALAVSMASLALFAAYKDDDEWKKREDWDRDAYWWFRIGETAYRIPKPFELGAIGTIAERTAEWMLSDEMDGKRFRERIAHMFAQTFALDPVPQAFKPLLDIYANRDSFTGRQIETPADQRLRPQDRYGERTSEVAKLLGGLGLPEPLQLIKGQYQALSPKQVDHLLRGYFSWVAVVGTTVSDYAVRAVADRGEKPDLRLKDMFFVGNFAEDLPANSSRYVTVMYEQAKDVAQAYATYREAMKRGDFEVADELRMENEGKFRSRGTFERSVEKLADLNTKARQIEADKEMSGADKRERLDMLNERRNEIAEMAVERARLLASD